MNPAKRKTADGISRDGPSNAVRFQAEQRDGNAKVVALQAGSHIHHASLAAQYREAARRNAEAGRQLGGKQGFTLIALADHFARRAHLHAVAAGGAR